MGNIKHNDSHINNTSSVPHALINYSYKIKKYIFINDALLYSNKISSFTISQICTLNKLIILRNNPYISMHLT